MINTIKNFFLETLGKELCVFLCSILPVLELRGAIPIGAAFKLPWWENYLLAVAGNCIPGIVILLFVRKLLEWMKKVKYLDKFAFWLEKKADKNKERIEKYSFWGLFTFVAIPLPGTGAWTGSLVAALVHVKVPKALLAVICGILTAGVIVTLISYGVLGFLSFLL